MNTSKHLQIAHQVGLLQFLRDEIPGAAQWEKLSPMLYSYARLVAKITHRHTVDNAVTLLKIQHAAAAGKHNTYLVAANLIQAELGGRE